MSEVETVMGVVDPNTKLARELFIGNLPLQGVNEAQLHQFLNSAMVQVVIVIVYLLYLRSIFFDFGLLWYCDLFIGFRWE